MCDEVASELRLLGAELHFALREVDIDGEPELREKYNDIVPVIAAGDRVIAHAPLAEGDLRTALTAALG